MEIRRTANAGVLLKLDGVSILLDGVSQKVSPYLATPPDIKEWLWSETPDALVFTHTHEDHYDPDFAAAYKARANGVIIGPDDLPENDTTIQPIKVGTIAITPVKSRHIGKIGEIEHFSYIIEGTQCVWFLGDASPLCWRQAGSYPKPDILIAPFAYATSVPVWERTKGIGAETVVLVHMPERDEDPFALWNAVESVIINETQINVFIPKLGERIVFH